MHNFVMENIKSSGIIYFFEIKISNLINYCM
jgi:hypothetical protein